MGCDDCAWCKYIPVSWKIDFGDYKCTHKSSTFGLSNEKHYDIREARSIDGSCGPTAIHFKRRAWIFRVLAMRFFCGEEEE